MQWDYDHNAFVLVHKVRTNFPKHARCFRRYNVQRKRFAVPVKKDQDIDASGAMSTFEAAQSIVAPFREQGHQWGELVPEPCMRDHSASAGGASLAMVAHEASACTAHEASEVGAQGALSLNDEGDIVMTLPALRDSL